MASIQIWRICFVFLLLHSTRTEGKGGDRKDEHVEVFAKKKDFYDLDLPWVQHEFRVEIAPGTDQCFYQKLKEGSQLLVSFEGLRGGDRKLDFFIKRPDRSTLAKHLWVDKGTTDVKVDEGGVYSFCLDNGFSRFTAKLASFYLLTYTKQDRTRYDKEIEGINLKVGKFTDRLGLIEWMLREMLRQQQKARRQATLDQYFIDANYAFVQNVSIVMIVIILSTAGCQLFFVKKLFNVQLTTSQTRKPRA